MRISFTIYTGPETMDHLVGAMNNAFSIKKKWNSPISMMWKNNHSRESECWVYSNAETPHETVRVTYTPFKEGYLINMELSDMIKSADLKLSRVEVPEISRLKTRITVYDAREEGRVHIHNHTFDNAFTVSRVIAHACSPADLKGAVSALREMSEAEEDILKATASSAII